MQQPRQVRPDQRFLARVDRIVKGLDLALGRGIEAGGRNAEQLH